MTKFALTASKVKVFLDIWAEHGGECSLGLDSLWCRPGSVERGTVTRRRARRLLSADHGGIMTHAQSR